MYKEDLALNNQQGLICHKTQLINQPYKLDIIYMHKQDLALNKPQGLICHYAQPLNQSHKSYVCIKSTWH